MKEKEVKIKELKEKIYLALKSHCKELNLDNDKNVYMFNGIKASIDRKGNYSVKNTHISIGNYIEIDDLNALYIIWKCIEHRRESLEYGFSSRLILDAIEYYKEMIEERKIYRNAMEHKK